MPISQQRMIAILDEAQRLKEWAEGLRRDLLNMLGGSDMGLEAKVEATYAILEISDPPPCIQLAIERDHFKRTERLNKRTAERMRIKRAREQNDERHSS